MKNIKNKIHKIVEKMSKNEALDFIDKYKDFIKKRDAIRKRNKVETIGEILKKTDKVLKKK